VIYASQPHMYLERMCQDAKVKLVSSPMFTDYGCLIFSFENFGTKLVRIKFNERVWFLEPKETISISITHAEMDDIPLGKELQVHALNNGL